MTIFGPPNYNSLSVFRQRANLIFGKKVNEWDKYSLCPSASPLSDCLTPPLSVSERLRDSPPHPGGWSGGQRAALHRPGSGGHWARHHSCGWVSHSPTQLSRDRTRDSPPPLSLSLSLLYMPQRSLHLKSFLMSLSIKP